MCRYRVTDEDAAPAAHLHNLYCACDLPTYFLQYIHIRIRVNDSEMSAYIIDRGSICVVLPIIMRKKNRFVNSIK